MTRYLIVLAFALFIRISAYATVPITKSSSQTKASSTLWNFDNQQELEELVKRNYDDPRASYYLINNAYQKGYATHIALLYIDNARSKRVVEPNSWASAAYAVAIGGGRYAFTLHKPDRDEFMKVQGYSGFLNNELEDAVKKAPKSPEVALMAAASTYAAIAGLSDGQGRRDLVRWRQVFAWLQLARELDPQWADAQYWYGVASQQYYGDTDKTDTFLLIRAKSALLTAQKLDPNMRGSCVWILWLVARDRNQLQEQLAYMDVWFKWQPRWSKKPYFRQLRAELVSRIAQAR